MSETQIIVLLKQGNISFGFYSVCSWYLHSGLNRDLFISRFGANNFFFNSKTLHYLVCLVSDTE